MLDQALLMRRAIKYTCDQQSISLDTVNKFSPELQEQFQDYKSNN